MTDRSWTTLYSDVDPGADAADTYIFPTDGSRPANGWSIFNRGAISSRKSLLNTVAHEYGHFKGAIVDPATGLWSNFKTDPADWNFGDGIDGYMKSTQMANSMHLGRKELSGVGTSESLAIKYPNYLTENGLNFGSGIFPANPVWYSHYVNNRWMYGWPVRYVFK